MDFDADEGVVFEDSGRAGQQGVVAWVGLVAFLAVFGLVGGGLVYVAVAAPNPTPTPTVAVTPFGLGLPNVTPTLTATTTATVTENPLALIETAQAGVAGFDRPTWLIDVYPRPGETVKPGVSGALWYPDATRYVGLRSWAIWQDGQAPPDGAGWHPLCVSLDLEALAARGLPIVLDPLSQTFAAITLYDRGNTPLSWRAYALLTRGATTMFQPTPVPNQTLAAMPTLTPRAGIVRCTWVNDPPGDYTVRLEVRLPQTVLTFGWRYTLTER